MKKRWISLVLICLAVFIPLEIVHADPQFSTAGSVLNSYRNVPNGVPPSPPKKIYLPVINKADPNRLFADTFSFGNTGWGPVYDTGGSAGILAGAYSLSHSQPNKFLAAIAPVSVGAFSNKGYSIQADMNLMSPTDVDSKLGFIFDWVTNTNFYMVNIQPSNGYYAINKYSVNIGYVVLTSGTSGLINPFDSTNTLKLIRKPASIELWIYSGGQFELLKSVADTRVNSGQVGLQLSVYADAPTEARYDNVIIANLP